VFHVAGDTGWWKKRCPPMAHQCHWDRQHHPIGQAQRRARVVIPARSIPSAQSHGLADETWTDFQFRPLGYHSAISKREAEKRALALNGDGIEVVAILPLR